MNPSATHSIAHTLGRKTAMRCSNGTVTDYAYETDSDLDWMRHTFQGGASASAANDNWVGIDYGYDKSGRVTQMAATDSRIMAAMPSTGTYGAANNLNQVASVPGRGAMTWSDAGNMKTDGKGTTFSHDGRNRLIKAVSADGTAMRYAYTPDGFRIESVKNPSGISAAGMPTGGTRTRYVLSGSEEVADLDANKNALRYFVPGPAIDERVAQIEANGAVTYMHTDRQSSVVAISDSAGNVTSRRGYGTYGETEPTQMTGTAAPPALRAFYGSKRSPGPFRLLRKPPPKPFGYTGRRWDPDLGLYYYRARWYDPALGTFLQTDPIGSLDYINLYSYMGLEPGNGTDPTGMCGFRYEDGSCRVLNLTTNSETNYEAGELEKGLNRWDNAINSLADDSVVNSVDKDGNVIGSQLGSAVKADWNSTGWAVTENGLMNWGNGGLGWARAEASGIGGQVTSEAVAEYLNTDGASGIDLFIGHEFGGHITDLGVFSRAQRNFGAITASEEERDANRHARGLGNAVGIAVPCRWGPPLCD